MRRRWERRRRLVWAGVLLGLIVMVAVLSVVDAGLRIYEQLASTAGDRRTKRKNRMFRSTGLATPRVSRA